MSDQAPQTKDAVWQRLDSLSSLLVDWERTAGRASPGSIEDNPTLDQSDLDRLYRGNVYAGRIVDLLPDECTRRGVEVTYREAEDRDDDEDPVGDELARLGALVLLGQADKLARKDGDAALYLGIDDGQAVDRPVDRERIRRVTHLSLVERWSLTPCSWQDDWTKPGFAEPLLWQLTPYNPGGASAGTVMVHRDRLLFLSGRWLPPRLKAYNGHHDDSVLQRCWRVLLDFRRSEKDIGTVLRSFNQATVTLPGLQQMLMAGNRDAVLTRLDLLNVGLSLSGMHLLGDGEQLDFKARAVSGLSELYDRLAQGLAAAAETPLTMLFGQAPGGLSTDDAGGRTYWYDRVVARQQNVYRPALRRLGELVALATDGPCAGLEPEDWDVQFPPLTEPTEKERQEAREAQARIDRAYWDMGVLSEQEIRASRFGGTTYSFETTLIEGEEPEPTEPDEVDPLAAPTDEERVDVLDRYPDLDWVPPAAVREAARLGCLRAMVGRVSAPDARLARRLARGEAVTPALVRQQASWWQAQGERVDSAGRHLLFSAERLLHGGEPGAEWFTALAGRLDEMDREREQTAGER